MTLNSQQNRTAHLRIARHHIHIPTDTYTYCHTEGWKLDKIVSYRSGAGVGWWGMMQPLRTPSFPSHPISGGNVEAWRVNFFLLDFLFYFISYFILSDREKKRTTDTYLLLAFEYKSLQFRRNIFKKSFFFKTGL